MANVIGTILGFIVGTAIKFAGYLVMTYFSIQVLTAWGFL